ncbi:uncharacterized protein ALTATR162_LOCUS942 [Alternaria atra]|uniref:Secreted protein n=1 Tax=Alternaria atra TaxID=119953 RepID=A0A8J2MWN7_9PLEO|nr:uncharacterized protein ALTATR162_LOCUS942 [Alternaria atra]CAG5141450.1 unnamed protein product [Alternaria atra]
MYTTILALLVAFMTMALTAPLARLDDPSNSTSTNIIPRLLDDNECPANKNHYPNFAAWELGVKQFCDNHGNQKIYWDKPVTVTITLFGRDGKQIEWVYKITVDNGNTPGAGGQLQWSYYPGANVCKDKFMGLTKDKGGGVGKVYCNWNDSKKHIHDHLMWGGKYDEVLNKDFFATVTWETRAKKDQKGL